LGVAPWLLKDRRPWVPAELSRAQPGQVRGTSRRHRKPAAGDCVSHIHTVYCCGVELPVADQMKVLVVVLDRSLTFDTHVSAAQRCSYHAHAIRHIRHLLSTDLAQTLACSLILSMIDYCNALLHSAPASSIQKLERVQSIAARIVLQEPRRPDFKPLLRQLH